MGLHEGRNFGSERYLIPPAHHPTLTAPPESLPFVYAVRTVERAIPVKAIVTVMLKEGVLDPQGKAIGHALGTLGFSGIGEVRVGKRIELELAEADPAAARAEAEEMGRKLLANTVIESFKVEIV